MAFFGQDTTPVVESSALTRNTARWKRQLLAYVLRVSRIGWRHGWPQQKKWTNAAPSTW